ARTRRRRGTRGSRLAAAPAAPGQACGGAARRRSQLPEHPRDATEDLDMLCVDRLECVVLRLQADAPTLAEEALHGRLVGRLVVACERDDDLPVPGVLSALHDDDVAVEDAGVHHRVALDAQ